MQQIASANEPDTVKVFNLLKALHDLTEKKRKEAPHLIPIADRAETIAAQFKERQMTTEEALKELNDLVQQQAEDEAVRRESDLSDVAFTVWRDLERDGIAGADSVARAVGAAAERHPQWRQSDEQERSLRTEVYKALIQAGEANVIERGAAILSLLAKLPT